MNRSSSAIAGLDVNGGSEESVTRASRLALFIVTAALTLVSAHTQLPALAQSAPNDTDLVVASGGRTVAVRGLTGGAVTVLPLEVYVSRVLAAEGEPAAPPATQQALAIAVRTFAMFNINRHSRDGFNLCDTTHCQVMRASNPASRMAALATAGRVLTYHGVVAEIFYSASCGGRSESAAAVWPSANLPYLKSIKDDVHDHDEEWTLEMTLQDVERVLERLGYFGSLTNVKVGDRTDSGRVATLRLSGLLPEKIAGDTFRNALGVTRLRSTAFSISKDHETLRFKGRGFGHGVGLCVIGAGRRGQRGDSADKILRHYFPGLAIASLR